MREKYLFISKNYIWSSSGRSYYLSHCNVIKHLSFKKILEKKQWRNSLALTLVFHVASQKSAVFLFTGVHKKLTKIFRERPHDCFRITIFFLQVSQINKKLEELSLKGWIRPQHLKAHRQISKKRCFEKYCLCDKGWQFSAVASTPWWSHLDNWRQIYKPTSWPIYTSNNISKRCSEEKLIRT